MSPQTIAHYLLVVSVKSSLFFIGAALITLGIRRRPAATRHLVWLGAVAGAALLPFVGPFVPSLNVPVLSPSDTPARSLAGESNEARRLASAPAPAAVSLHSVPNGTASLSSELSTLATGTSGPGHEVNRMPLLDNASRLGAGMLALLVAWAFGGLWFLAQIVLSVLSLIRLERRATPLTSSAWERALGAVMSRDRGITLLVSDDVDVPLTWGIRRPIILLPREADEWSQSRRELVLRHEVAHVDRYDVLTQLLARVVRALHWPNPLAWLAEGKLRRECEQACDDAVLSAGVRPTRYAEELLEIASALTPVGVAWLAPGFASRPSLEARLRAILDARPTRGRATRLDAAFTVAGVLALALPVAAMSPGERTVSLHHASVAEVAAPVISVMPPLVSRGAPRPASQRLAQHVASPVPAHAALESLGTAVATQLCSNDGGSHSNWNEERYGTKTWNVHWSGRDCAVDLRAEGEIEFNDDLTDIASISPNGFFDLSVRDGDELTRLVVKPAGRGELDRRYTMNGSERSWDGRAQAWFADFLLELDRQTGFGINIRFPKLLARGVPAVLDEITKLGGDYVRGLYFQRLIDGAKLSPSQVRQTLELAGRDVRSDYELARILVGVSDRYGLPDEDTRAVFLTAVNSLSSDYERNRALQALLSRSDLSSREAPAVLQAASALTSDYELARTLVAMTEKRLISPALHPLYLQDVAKITSDYERARVIIALLGSGKLPNSEVAQVIGLGSNIKSDYERARVLVAVADAYDLGDDARDAYLKAARSISSEYERGRALAALRGR